MKPATLISACLLLIAGSLQVLAQDAPAAQPGPRDLFNTYNRAETATSPAPASAHVNKPAAGRPGVKVRVELDRGGRARWVSTKTSFRAGDKVRFHFAMNFAGYVAILNEGSSGKRSLLFPYEGVSNRVGRTADYTVPQGEAWFEFDDTPGMEQLTFIMSKREIPEVTQITTPATHAAPASAPVAAPASVPAEEAPAPLTEEQEILAALNSRSLTQGRDLKLVEDNADGYVLATDEALAKPVGFTLKLTHR